MSGIVTGKDSNWLMSCTFNRQSQFRNQPKGQLVGWIYGLFSDKPGNFVKRKDRIAPVRGRILPQYVRQRIFSMQ
ncbi:MAG: oleate hydratase [Bacteroides cellulosilyticus]